MTVSLKDRIEQKIAYHSLDDLTDEDIAVRYGFRLVDVMEYRLQMEKAFYQADDK